MHQIPFIQELVKNLDTRDKPITQFHPSMNQLFYVTL